MTNKNERRDEIVRWLDEDFIASFTRDVDPTIWTIVDGRHERGFFAITLLSLSFCDAMARLVAGKAEGQIDTIGFIESHHGALGLPTDVRYQQRAAALFTLFRHRLVHQREPGKLQIEDKVLTWEISRGGRRERHLSLLPTAEEKEFALSIDADALQDDTRRAFARIRDRCLNEPALVSTIRRGRESVQSARPMPKPDSKNEWVVGKIAQMLKSPDAI